MKCSRLGGEPPMAARWRGMVKNKHIGRKP